MTQKLKYLFRAEFLDGSVYSQNPEDVSLTDPKRSCFYDVLELEKERGRVTRFMLGYQHPHKAFSNLILGVMSVDLLTGAFEAHNSEDSIVFFAGDPRDRLPHVAGLEYRLIFFRRHTIHSHPLPDGGLQMGAGGIEFHLGWQVTIEGRNVQNTVVLR